MKTLALAALVVAACSSKPTSSRVDNDEAKKLLIDRNWLDRMPETQHDRLHVYRFVPKMGGGVYQDRTLYKGTFELFMFEVDGERIRFALPETREKVTTRFRIDEVDGPEPFDLKLTIADDPRGPHVYYGMRDESEAVRTLSRW
jgi:hypothetical protein